MRRAVIYFFYDPQGQVDDYIPYQLRALRESADHIFVVSNSHLTPQGRQALDEVADTVWVRENTGFDVWAYKEAMAAFGWDRLGEYDELILMNHTFYGPIFPFSETFEAMDARSDIDFWGLTAHGRLEENPVPGSSGPLPFHIQSHWIAVRRTMLQSIEFRSYWEQMRPIVSYYDSILQHEGRFTQWFSDRGFRYAVAFPPENYPSDHPLHENIVLMLEDRCPIVKRRLFFNDPGYHERFAILGKRVMEIVAASDYPEDLIWRNAARGAEPRSMYTNMSMLSIIPDSDLPESERADRPVLADPPRICVLAHIYYEDMTEEMVGWMRRIPAPFDLVVTTSTPAKQTAIRAALAACGLGDAEVRLVESNRGRAESAFLIACRDVLRSGRYDLILKIHSKKSPQDGHNLGHLFRHHVVDNLLSSPGYVAEILQQFADRPSLGMLFPPVVNIGFPTLGHAWFTNKERARELAAELDIDVPFDASTPIAAYGGMFWARPEALARIIDHDFAYEDFADTEHGYGDGMLGHVLERLWAYASLSSGYAVRSVINTDWAEINYAFLEWKLQKISSVLPAHTDDQVAWVQRADEALRSAIAAPVVVEVAATEPPLVSVKRAVDETYPRMGQVLRPLYRIARSAARAARSGRRA
ncbi:lipopolysaccharide biosynthesis protein [Nakamurella sp. YIM 132084]|uniref:Lipopolysaccharide biosynthesis protein n=1 Tax=Nakamurella leprariae TaxID=2803911 RepID=A0A938YDS0_9ACTN|nr:lipopolysaccharide biosynthesis protein [Nakamurella leprariae]